MTNYMVFFMTPISAKSEKDLSRKTERIENAMTMAIGKRVQAHGYAEIEEKEQIKIGEKGDD